MGRYLYVWGVLYVIIWCLCLIVWNGLIIIRLIVIIGRFNVNFLEFICICFFICLRIIGRGYSICFYVLFCVWVF